MKRLTSIRGSVVNGVGPCSIRSKRISRSLPRPVCKANAANTSQTVPVNPGRQTLPAFHWIEDRGFTDDDIEGA
jgi:hypothetical protein